MSDWQRLVRGSLLVAQELYRQQHAEVARATRLFGRHSVDVYSKLPRARPNAPVSEPVSASSADGFGSSAAAFQTAAEMKGDASSWASATPPLWSELPSAASSPVGRDLGSRPVPADDAVFTPGQSMWLPSAQPAALQAAQPSSASATLPAATDSNISPQPVSNSSKVDRHVASATLPSTAQSATAAAVLRSTETSDRVSTSSAVAASTPAPTPAAAAAAAASATVSSHPLAAPLPRLPLDGVQPSAPKRKREFRERAVPASPLARVWGFGSLAASMALGAAGEAVGRTLGLGGAAAASPAVAQRADAAVSASSAPAAGGTGAGGAGAAAAPAGGAGLFAAGPDGRAAINISPAQAERLAEGLCRMRGAALKIGQMLSLSDESLIPPAIAAVLERVRTAADIMPRRQLEQVMREELGDDWRARLGGDAFEDTPVAAASIGQVHRSVLPDGRKVAIKVQYPGVAESITSDIANLKRLLMVASFLPPGLYIDSLLKVAKEELTEECDYRKEAAKQERFRAFAASDSDFEVPAVVKELSTRRVLVSTWLEGMPIDQIVEQGYPQHVRDHVARKLLKLTLRELFEWRFMQTDPNWGNFFYDPVRDKIGLLDFGAARAFPKDFVDDYLNIVWAAANNDGDTVRELSVKLGFLTGFESQVMVDAHVASGLVVGEPFRDDAPFDFKASGITRRVAAYGGVFAEHRLSPPPSEVYSLHRKLAGAFLICIRMGAVMRCRDLLQTTYEAHKWGPVDEDVPAIEGAAAVTA